MREDQSSSQPVSELGPIQSDKPSFWRRHRISLIAIAAAAVIGGGVTAYGLLQQAPAPAKTISAEEIRTSANPNHWKGTTDPTAIPLGDGKISSAPKAGYIYACSANFRTGGAEHAGPWINASANTWDSEAKVAAGGAVTWPAASHTEKIGDQTRIITTNDLPKGYTTGIFPIAVGDPAYVYDRNPNAIGTQSLTYEFPLNPVTATAPNCVGLGSIGVLINGVALFNGLDAAGHDAAAHEIQDNCNGHPDGQEIYHYHDVPSCLRGQAKGSSTLVGYANDGYGIYVERDARGNLPTNADLDECHGRVSEVNWNGQRTRIYHYDATLEYPYTVGCYHGKPVPVAGAHHQAGGPTRLRP